MHSSVFHGCMCVCVCVIMQVCTHAYMPAHAKAIAPGTSTCSCLASSMKSRGIFCFPPPSSLSPPPAPGLPLPLVSSITCQEEVHQQSQAHLEAEVRDWEIGLVPSTCCSWDLARVQPCPRLQHKNCLQHLSVTGKSSLE